jgi:hypothetical protein
LPRLLIRHARDLHVNEYHAYPHVEEREWNQPTNQPTINVSLEATTHKNFK